MLRMDSKSRIGDEDMRSLMHERVCDAATDQMKQDAAAYCRDASGVYFIPASNLVSLRVQHRRSHPHAAELPDANLITTSSYDAVRHELPTLIADEPRLRLTIVFRRTWQIEICFPRWCSGIFSGIIRLRI